MFKITSLSLVLYFISLIIVDCLAQQEETTTESFRNPCDVIRCGYGRTCEVGRDGRGRCVCPTICTQEYRPVCGSDGRTYSNPCHLNVAACQQGREIRFREGACNRRGTTIRPPRCQRETSMNNNNFEDDSSFEDNYNRFIDHQ